MNTLSTQTLQQSWRAWLGSDPHYTGPKSLSLLWTFLFSCACAVGFTILGFASFANGEGAWRNWAGWWHWYQINLIVALCIGFTIRGLFVLGYRWLGTQRLRQLTGFKRLAFYIGIPNLGVAIGWPLGSAVAGYEAISWGILKDPNTLVASVLLATLISFIFYLIFNTAARRLQAEKRAAEAQLRLLQGQIEPHFLFNTLANVSSLMDDDVPRAKLMLETFTDYLRASLGSLRCLDATLDAELELVTHYLELMKTRMEVRLQYSVVCDPNLRDVVMPPFLLQPLVENALHHGLEPKVEGGSIRVSARQEGAELVLEVVDDGMGPDATRRRPGAGIALANVRERLQVQYGNAATLTLSPAEPGMRATIRMPYLTRA
ncbi:MAG: sensor histidine kinase [Candidatus Saccharibacteria bacterium]|nr:sensor histidine kinase [Rhodoferax sp.]